MKIDIELRCRRKADELLEQYFPNFIHEAAIERPEKLGFTYNDELPDKIKAEFHQWLSELWTEIAPADAKPFDEVMNLQRSMSMVDTSYVPYLKEAREDALQISLWEKLTKSNHEDVTYYKGLLRQYTKELLDTMVKDFMGDIE